MSNFEEEFEYSLATATVNRTRDFREGDTYPAMTTGSGVERVFSPERDARIVEHQRRIRAGLRALKRDPSRTTLLRRRLANAMKKKFRELRRVIRELVVTDDAFGLVPGTPVEMQVRQAWRFQTDANKVLSYRKWLQGQVDQKILTVGGVDGKSWTSDYVEHAYKKGMGRSYVDVTRLEAGIYEGTKEQFLRDAFNAPEMLSKIELVSTRAFTQLKGVTDAMSQQMSRIIADGLAAGRGPAAIARELTDNVTKLTNTRALVLARTEIIHAHAEGQLDGFERLGVKEVGIEAELSTAGDDLVCERCLAVESDGPYLVKKARGMIPVHPNCRCAWIPVTEKKKKDEVLEYRLPELPDTAEAKALLATEKTLRVETAALRKAYRAGDKKLRPELMRLKAELQAARTKIDDLARGVTPTPVTPTPVTVPKPPVPVTPTPAGTAGTKFATAEDYRQYLLQQVEAAKTPEIVREIDRLSNEAKAVWKKWTNTYAVDPKHAEYAEQGYRLDKKLKALRKQVKVSVEAQRQLLDEVSSQVGQCKLVAGKAELKAYQEVHDSILRWIPGKRETAFDFGQVGVEGYSRGASSLAGQYSFDRTTISMYMKSKQVYAHEFGHHVAYQLKGFMGAQTRFFRDRTVGEKIVQLMRDFRGKKDKWGRIDVYAGRVYESIKYGHKAPEVASVGIEALWKNPVKFAKKDPEWFNMIVSQLKGIPTKPTAEMIAAKKAAEVAVKIAAKEAAEVAAKKVAREAAEKISEKVIKTTRALGGKASGVPLTPADIKAIEQYQLGAYWDFRNYQLGKKLVGKETKEQVAKRIGDIEEAMSKLPGFKGTSYRGLELKNAAAREKFISQFKEGEIWTSKTFQSTSESISKAKQFAGYPDPGKGATLIKFEGLTGRSLKNFGSNFGDEEMEILFKAGTRFKVTRVTERSIYLKEVAEEGIKIPIVPKPVSIFKQQQEAWLKTLTGAQKESVTKFTTYSTEVRHAQRKLARGEITLKTATDLEKEHLTTASHIEKLISDAPITDKQIWRGMNYRHGDKRWMEFQRALDSGKDFSFESIQSFTKSKKMATAYSEEKSVRIMLSFKKAPSRSADIQRLSTVYKEEEVVLGANAKYRVVSRSKTLGRGGIERYVYELEEVVEKITKEVVEEVVERVISKKVVGRVAKVSKPAVEKLLKKETSLALRLKKVRKAYRGGDRKLRGALLKLKEELRIVQDAIDDATKGIKIPKVVKPKVVKPKVVEPVIPKEFSKPTYPDWGTSTRWTGARPAGVMTEKERLAALLKEGGRYPRDPLYDWTVSLGGKKIRTEDWKLWQKIKAMNKKEGLIKPTPLPPGKLTQAQVFKYADARQRWAVIQWQHESFISIEMTKIQRGIKATGAWKGQQAKYYLPHLEKLVEKLPNYKGVTYRGMTLDKAQATKMFKQKTWTAKSFASTSPKQNIAREFATTERTDLDRVGILIKVKQKTGAEFGKFRDYRHNIENEVLIRKGTKFNINKAVLKYDKKLGGDYWEVTMTEISGVEIGEVAKVAKVGREIVERVVKVKKVVSKKIPKVSKTIDILTKKIKPLNQEMRNLTKDLNEFVRKGNFGKGYQDVLSKQLGINKYVIKLREEIKALKVAEKAGALPLRKIPIVKPGKELKIPPRPKVKRAETFEKWLKDLKSFEKKALKRWTSEDYSYMARAYDDFLKGNTSKFNSKGWDYVKKMQAMENALDKSPGVKGQLWRGVWTEIDSPQYKNIMPAMKKGKVFQLPRITSFTSNEQVAREYADWATVTPKKSHLKMARIKFVLKKAPRRSASVDPFTISGGESEVLVGGGTKFRVIKIVRDKTAPDIKMEVFLEVVK